MSGRSLNVVIAGCMLTVTAVYVYYSRKADREYRSTMDSLESIKTTLIEPANSPRWTEEG